MRKFLLISGERSAPKIIKLEDSHMFYPKSLQQRLAIFVLFPVALLLIGMGFVGFIYARNSLISQWREAAILKLQRAAHSVDMRLSRTKEWIQALDIAGENRNPDIIYGWIVNQLKNIEGVSRVNLTWIDKNGRARIKDITPPKYDSLIEHKTVSLNSDLIDKSGQTIGSFEVILRFDYLTKDIINTGWWQSNKAFLVDENGNILTGTVPEARKVLADNNDPVERKTLNALKIMPYGTIRGSGHPPAEVSGFYRLQEAPWSLVMIAPGEKILSPIVRFRSYYLIVGAAFIVLILLLIKIVTGRTVSSIKDISLAADGIAQGNFGKLLPVKTQDEVGELTRSFNKMMFQLEDRIRIKQALNVAMEVQQNLLPLEMPKIAGLDIAGKSIYCDETGGDFFDFIEVHRQAENGLGISVGDVSGHGISAALLMATIRAFIKSNVTLPTSIAESITSANRLMTQDMRDTGQFVTLFYTEISPIGKTLRWVRAGHDPAIFYDPNRDKFEELRGEGIALGIDPDFKFQENIIESVSEGQILLVGTDGLWEAQNQKGEMFGKQRLKALVRQHSESSSDAILKAIINSIKKFQDSVTQEDDITLLVIKIIA
jgi:sigma-B regulation protein RsbU (phosphoserine phosphatase)